MSRGNGKVEVIREEEDTFDLEQQRRAVEAAAAAADVVEIPVLSELELLRAERDSLVDRLARLQAEFENARKRTQREQQEFRDYATTGTLKSLLPVLDSFERAITSPNLEAAEFRSGVELIYRQFSDALTRAGLRPLEAKGQRFDPRLHEAIEMVDTTEAPDQHVLDELQRGYTLKERLLRPAMVRVARNSQK